MKPSQSANLKGFCRAAGVPQSAHIEYAVRPEKIDHVWITLNCGERMRVAVNTRSLRNGDAGFDPRVRLGIIRSDYKHLPDQGLFACEGLDYRQIESMHNVFYEHYEQHALEELLIAKTERATFLEVWGEVYRHNHFGIHQVHCRRTSCAVAEDIEFRDGALRFYFPHQSSETLLFKFCGQI